MFMYAFINKRYLVSICVKHLSFDMNTSDKLF